MPEIAPFDRHLTAEPDPVHHGSQAEEHVALGARHIARQVQIIDKLARAGHSTGLAFDLLDSYCELQVYHVAHRDRIRKQLDK